MSLLARALAMLCGVLALLMSSEFPSAAALLAVSLAASAGLAFPRRVFAITVATWFCGGYLLSAAHTHEYLRSRWNDTSGARSLVTAIVETIPSMHGAAWQFDAIGDDRRIRLISRDASLRPRAGERWQLLVTLQQPRARLNPGTVDYERQLFQDRVHALGTVVPSRLNRLIDSGHHPLTSVRERIARHIDARVTDRDAAALITALAVGVTDAMSREQWRVFNATGTTHLVAISGLHVTLFALVAMAFARGLWWVGVCRLTRLPRENFAAVFGLGAAIAYSALAGFSVPTQRTLMMLAAWLLVRNLARSTTPGAPIAVALLAVLALDPFAVLAPGFWLSFGAMAAILFITQPRVVPRGKIHDAFAVQGAVSLALTPFTLGWFGTVSLVGPAVNILAIPLFSWLLVPIVLLGIVTLPVIPAVSDLLLALAARFHDLGWPWLSAAADVPFALAYANPPRWWYVAAMIAVVISLMPWPIRLRLAALVCVAPLAIAGAAERPVEGGARITILDVGRATAIVVQTRRHALLFGTADSYGTHGRNVDGVVVPFLRSRGIHALDALVFDGSTHRSEGGVTALFAAMPVRQTLPTKVGATWHWDGVSFRREANTLLIEAAGTRVVLSEKAKPGRAMPGTQVLATADSGAIELFLEPGAGLRALREERRERLALWRP